MDPFQFKDLPQIPGDMAEEPSLALWAPGYSAHFLHAPNTSGGRTLHPSQLHMPYSESGPSSMQPLQRYLHGTDPLPFAFGLQYPEVHHSLPLQSQHLRYHEQQWPSADCLSYTVRNDSPDRTSVSGDSSHYPQNELSSPRPYCQVPYSSPRDLYNPGTSYPSPRLSADGGGICCPKDIQYEQDRPEHTMEDYEQDYAETKSEYEYTPEPRFEQPQHVESLDSVFDPAITNAYQKEESVKPAADESDSDYEPGQYRRRRSSASSGSGQQSRRRRKNASNVNSDRTRTSSNGNRVNKRARQNSSSGPKKSHGNRNTDAQRPFPCPLTGYGCQSTFSSKNEWKRHAGTQHIKLGFWRCDLCAPGLDANDDDTVYHNDFNRKDLFTQHLRRMHGDDSRGKSEHPPVNDDNIVEHQKRCYQTLRSTPPKSSCLFCNDIFEGPTSWEERMEHVGRHLEKDRKPGMLDVSTWNVDQDLEAWLVDEGVITFDRGSGWKIGDGKRIVSDIEDDA